MFSFNTLKLNKNAKFPGMLVFLLLFLILFEIFFSLPSNQIKTKKLYKPTLRFKEVYPKVQYLNEWSQNRHINVIFIGDSHMAQAVNPEVFDSEYKRISKQPLFSFNGSLNGVTTTVYDILIRDFYAPVTTFDCIIYGTSAKMINSGSKSLLEITNMFKSDLMYAPQMSYIEEKFRLNLYHYRIYINGYITSFLNFPSLLTVEQRPSQMPSFNKRGFVNLKKTSKHIKPKVQDHRFENFTTTGYLTESLENTAGWCRENNVKLILVNLPVHKYFNTHFPNGDADYQDYISTLKNIALKYNALFWDADGQYEFSDEEFFDISHLNTKGAYRLSKLLAKEYSTKNN